MVTEARVRIERESDIVEARQKGRELAKEAGLFGSDVTMVATAISEVARNIVVYARRGEIFLEIVQDRGKRGIVVIARDDGPGIADVERAMRDGFSTGGSLGLGLPGARRLMDDFEIESQAGVGTTVILKKWTR